MPEDTTIGSIGGFQTVKLIPDGACQFTRGMGMSCRWDADFGERSWRYSMVVNHGIIEVLFLEHGAVIQNADIDPFDVSSADHMMAYLKSAPPIQERK